MPHKSAKWHQSLRSLCDWSHVRKSILLQALYLVALNYTKKLLSYVWYRCSSMSGEPLVWDVHWRDSAVLTFTHLLLGPQKTSPFQNSVLKASTDQQNWEPKRFIVSTHQRQECPSAHAMQKRKSIKMHRELNKRIKKKHKHHFASQKLWTAQLRRKTQATSYATAPAHWLQKAAPILLPLKKKQGHHEKLWETLEIALKDLHLEAMSSASSSLSFSWAHELI